MPQWVFLLVPCKSKRKDLDFNESEVVAAVQYSFTKVPTFQIHQKEAQIRKTQPSFTGFGNAGCRNSLFSKEIGNAEIVAKAFWSNFHSIGWGLFGVVPKTGHFFPHGKNIAHKCLLFLRMTFLQWSNV